MIRLFPCLNEDEFRVFFVSTLPSTLAVQMSMVAVGFSAFALSGSATVLGGVSVATGLSMLMFALVGGVVADRASRRLVLMGTQSVLGLGAAAIAVLAGAGHLAVWHLYLLGFSQGIAFSFNMPARQALMADLVGPRYLRSAVSLLNATLNFSRIAGPSLAGWLLSVPFVGVVGTFSVMVAMYLAVLVALFRLGEPPLRASSGRGGWAEMIDGFDHIRGSRPLLILLVLGFVPLFFGLPFQSLLPLFAERVHDVGPGGLGLMNAAVGLGALVGSLGVAAVSRRTDEIQAALGVGFGLGVVGFGLAPSFPLALASLAIAGAASAGYAALNQTMVMVHTAPQFHGRVMSIYMLSFGLMPLATLPEAWLADQLGGPVAMIAAGALVVLSVAIATALAPGLRRPNQ